MHHCLQLFSFSYADSSRCTELKLLTKLKPFRIGQGFCSSSVSKFSIVLLFSVSFALMFMSLCCSLMSSVSNVVICFDVSCN